MNSSLSISSQPVFTAKISVIAQAKLLSKEDSNTLKAIAKNIGTDDDIIHLTVKESKKHPDTAFWAEHTADFHLGHKAYKTRASKNVSAGKFSPFNYCKRILSILKNAYIKMQNSKV